jgi:catechol 2,3-dioxygenase-like lactoylglutathione lyase family enzyme
MIQRGIVTVMVKDMALAIDFYVDKLGFSQTFRAGDNWAELQAPGLTLGLHICKEGCDAGGNVSIGLEVADLSAAVAQLKAKGVHLEPSTTCEGPVRLAPFNDPDGTELYLCQVMQR